MLNLTIHKIPGSSSVEVHNNKGALVGVYNPAQARATIERLETEFAELVGRKQKELEQAAVIAKSEADRAAQEKAVNDAALEVAQANLDRIAVLEAKNDRTPEESIELEILKK